jgi:hypothetical protein
MGYKNAPAHFARCIDILLAEEGLTEHNAAFMDDITTFGEDFESYVDHQRKLFVALRNRNWLIAADKLRLGYKMVLVLGWLVGNGTRRADPAKVDGITKLLPPKDASGIKTFLGAIGWYRDLIKNFGRVAKPLTKLLKKDEPFVWGQDQQASFDKLKDILVSSPVLHLP